MLIVHGRRKKAQRRHRPFSKYDKYILFIVYELHGQKRADLSKGLWQALECKLVAAEFTVAAVGGGEPVLQTGPVHHGQATAALAGGQQLP